MGRAVLYMSGELFTELLMAGPPRSYAILENGLPADTRLIEVRHAAYSGYGLTLALLLESAVWPDLPEGELEPILPPIKVGLVPLIIQLRPIEQ